MPASGGGRAIGAGATGGHGFGGLHLDRNSIVFKWTSTATPDQAPQDVLVHVSDLGLAAETWIHVAFTIDFLEGRVAVYVDGRRRSTTLVPVVPSTWTPVESYSAGQPDRIGGRFVNVSYSFLGALDEVQACDRALDACEVRAIYEAGAAGACRDDADGDGAGDVCDCAPADAGVFASPREVCRLQVGARACVPLPEGLVGWWSGDGDGDGNDGAGTHHGTSAGGVAFVPGVVVSGTGEAFDFDGIDGRIELGTHSPFRQSSAITYTFWATMPAGGGGRPMGAGAAGGHGFGGLTLVPTGMSFAWTPAAPGSDTSIDAALSLPADEWFHVAVTLDYQAPDFGAGGYAMYLNGRVVATTISQVPTDATPVASYSSGQPDRIGDRVVNVSAFFDGSIDEVQVYDRALAPPEISVIFRTGRAGMCKEHSRRGDARVVAWDSEATRAGADTAYDVLRGRIDELEVGDGASESCLDASTVHVNTADTDVPAPPEVFWYLVRGANSCGVGSYGFASDTERFSLTCP